MGRNVYTLLNEGCDALIKNTVKAAIDEYNMIEKGAEVTVALSGGADSVSLLICLLELRDEYEFTLNAAHLNHSLRGSESDDDEIFVRELCKTLGVRLFCESADINALSKASGESIELTARKVRYDFLNRVSNGVIATAHTANDNLETVLHNMVRGSGLSGMTGIPAKRDNIIRPLIFTEREQIEEYLKRKNLTYRTDSSNLQDIYTRNKLRHAVVPVLKEVNSNAVGNVSRLTETLKQDIGLIDELTDKAYSECFESGGLKVEKLLGLHVSILSRVISRFYEQQVGCLPEQVHIRFICDALKSGKTCQSVQKDKYAVIKNGLLLFRDKPQAVEEFAFLVESIPCILKNVSIFTESYENFKKISSVNSLLLKSAVDYDKICGKLVLRSRNNGDKLSLPHRNVTKSLKKLFNEVKIDPNERQSVSVIADDNGVVWVDGFGVDRRVAVDSSTKTVLIFEMLF